MDAAYQAAYDALADTPAAAADALRGAIAQQVADTVRRLGIKRGLGWLRDMQDIDRYDQAQQVAQRGSFDAELIAGRAALHRAYCAATAVVVATYRPPESGS